MALTRRERQAQGAAAEDRFRGWLDRCHLPHIYVEQVRRESRISDCLAGGLPCSSKLDLMTKPAVPSAVAQGCGRDWQRSCPKPPR